MFNGSGLGLCPEIRATGSSVQERCQAQTSLSWDFPVAYSPPACTEQQQQQQQKDLTRSVFGQNVRVLS